jgi:valyl-tRNA synthetase
MVAGPDGRHMSKSYGNTVSPDEIMPKFGTDAIRQWAALGSLGDDYPFEYTWINIHNKQPVSDEKINREKKSLPNDKFNKKYRKRYDQLVGASRFITKIWNAFRFLYINLEKLKISDINFSQSNLSEIDSYFYSEFNKNLKLMTENLDKYNWHDAFTLLRPFFWNEICDNYIEAIKYRFYSENESIKKTALINALNLFYEFLKIFSIFMPFISEEIYSIVYKPFKELKSIHLESWSNGYSQISSKKAEIGKMGIDIIKFLRNLKSKSKMPLNQEIERIILLTSDENIEKIEKISEDITNTIRINRLDLLNSEHENEIEIIPDVKEKFDDYGILTYFFK